MNISHIQAVDNVETLAKRLADICAMAESSKNSVSTHSIRLLLNEVKATPSALPTTQTTAADIPQIAAGLDAPPKGIIPYVHATMSRHGFDYPGPGQKLSLYFVNQRLAEQNIPMGKRVEIKLALHQSGLL